MTRTDIVIAGAGCAGLSLAVHLLEAGVDREIVLVEPRTTYRADRTWSFWKMGRHPFEPCVSRQWTAWKVASGERSVVRSSARHPYQQIPSDRFYRFALERLRRAPNVELRTGTRVLELRDLGSEVAVTTDSGTLRASIAFDSRPPPQSEIAEGELVQHFAGWEVVLPRPAFDPQVATLMDFAPPAEGAVRFTYVLPASERRALVEATWISRRPLAHETYRQAIRDHLLERYGMAPSRVEREEQGLLPMSRRSRPRAASRRVMRIGTAGGAVRPSTGYAFLAIQRHSAETARRTAKALADRELPTPASPYRRRSELLDRLFLTYLGQDLSRGPELFVDLFDRVPAGALARFLSDRGSWLDDLRVIREMPRLDLSATALRMLRPAWTG